MSAAAKYGLLLGIVASAAFALRNPLVLALVCFLLSLELLAAAFIVWQRMRLPYSSAAMLSGAAALLLFGVWSLTGSSFIDRPWPELLALSILLADGPIFFWLDSRRHSDRWAAWRRAVESSSLRDMLLFRHIPQL